MTGDGHWHHHVEGSGGAILFGTFILAMAGLLLVIARRWGEPWWRFVLYGLAASIGPGAIADLLFHEVRLMGYAVFLMVLTVPAVQWLLAPDASQRIPRWQSEETAGRKGDRLEVMRGSFSRPTRLSVLALLLTA